MIAHLATVDVDPLYAFVTVALVVPAWSALLTLVFI